PGLRYPRRMPVEDDRHRTTAELLAGVAEVRRSPTDGGVVELIVRRPDRDAREILEEAELDLLEGLVGDDWRTRGSRDTADGSADGQRQLGLVNARAIALIAGERPRWALAGDQLYVDLDLSEANLPPGCRLRVGTAVVEITGAPHTGCQKF